MIRVVRKLKIQGLVASRLNVPVKEFIKSANISKQTYYDFMTGKHRPTFATINKVCKYFGVSNAPYLEDMLQGVKQNEC